MKHWFITNVWVLAFALVKFVCDEENVLQICVRHTPNDHQICWWQFTFMLKTMQHDFTHCFNHWKMNGWIKKKIVLKLFQVTNGSWIQIHQIHEAWNWSLNQKWPKQSLTRNYFNKQEIVFVYDHVEWYAFQQAFMRLVPNLIKSTMLSHRLLFTWKVYSFQVISHFSLNLQYIKVMKKI
jgi:hypothetical protein